VIDGKTRFIAQSSYKEFKTRARDAGKSVSIKARVDEEAIVRYPILLRRLARNTS
jgi:hypothetical protein